MGITVFRSMISSCMHLAASLWSNTKKPRNWLLWGTESTSLLCTSVPGTCIFVAVLQDHLLVQKSILNSVIALHRSKLDCPRNQSVLSRCGSRIWSGGAQLPRPKVANVVGWSHASKASYLWPGSRVSLRALEAFGFLMLKYALWGAHSGDSFSLSFDI